MQLLGTQNLFVHCKTEKNFPTIGEARLSTVWIEMKPNIHTCILYLITPHLVHKSTWSEVFRTFHKKIYICTKRFKGQAGVSALRDSDCLLHFLCNGKTVTSSGRKMAFVKFESLCDMPLQKLWSDF